MKGKGADEGKGRGGEGREGMKGECSCPGYICKAINYLLLCVLYLCMNS